MYTVFVNIAMFIMLLCGGLFAGGVLAIAWTRVGAWKSMPFDAFKTDFGQTIKIADKLQPALAVGAILGAVLFGAGESGQAQTLALMSAAGFLATLLASVTILVPLQRRILRVQEESTATDAMRARWSTGHLGRTALSLISFALAAAAAAFW